jgi:hypothetical protein
MFWQRLDRSIKETAAVRLGTVLALLAVSPMCMGAVYRCTAQDGSITYSDARCGPDAKAVALPAQHGPTVKQKSPLVIAPHGANVGHAAISDQPEARQSAGCLELSQLDNTRTPPDLYLGIAACIQQDNYRAAVAIFALAGMEGHFDAARVADKTAGQAGQILINGTFDGLGAEKREKFARTIKDVAADSQALALTCNRIRRIGFPAYYPAYMVMHGIHAFTAHPGDPTIEPAFDSAATWESLLKSYLNCHA